MRIVTVVGARPQFIKAAVVSRQLRQLQEIQEILIHTGQHYDDNMSQIFFSELDLPIPNYHLGIGSSRHGVQTARMLEMLESHFLEIKPDWVLVYGDTNSTLAGALAAAKLNLRVAHVEAGLRSFNRQMPEEINRVLTDHVSQLLFAPTSTAVENLQREGISMGAIHHVGDVMYDAALFYMSIADQKTSILDQLNLAPRSYILATIHRASNTDDLNTLQTIFDALVQVAKQVPIILPLHPRTRLALAQAGLLPNYAEKLRIIEPVGYLEMIQLEKAARLIVTDSGGVQKEAFFYCVPCVTLREETEWIELVNIGANMLCSPHDSSLIAACIVHQLDVPVSPDSKLYGDGSAALQIVNLLINAVE